MRRLTCLLAVLGLNSTASAATIHVPAEQPTLAAGLAAAIEGDTVLVDCGNYEEWALLVPGGVTLRSSAGDPQCVVIDALGNARGLEFGASGALARIEGITLVNGYASIGGGGAEIVGAQVAFADCRFSGNLAGHGGAVSISGVDVDASFSRCTFDDNAADQDGGALNEAAEGTSTLTLSDCLFVGNQAGRDGGGVALRANPALHSIQGCTFDGNGAVRSGGGVSTYNALHLERCLITNSTSQGAIGAVWPFSEFVVTLDCCDLWANTGGDYDPMFLDLLGVDGNISEDPRFCDGPGGGNFTIQDDSPCAAANSGCGLLIGAGDVGCQDTAIAPISWSRVKSLY